MNILQHPDAMNAPELHIWNNIAFDNNDESELSAAIKASWSSLHRSSESLQSDCSKENLSPEFAKTPISVKSSAPTKPLQPNSMVVNSQAKPPKLLFKEGLLLGGENQEEGDKTRDEKRIDSEIAEIEQEISRLSSRLEALRLEKAERNAKTIERRGRIVQAKFLDPPPKQSVKIEENLPPSSTKTKLNRRGLSLGPSEIVAGAGLRRLSKLEITPVQAIQNRRKSCFWKLQDVDELRATKERGKSLSLSPKARKTVSKTQPPKQPATTACSSKRIVKKEEAILSAIQPKKLFKEGEKSVTAKKPMRPGRVVASRYNSGMSDGRKRSLPEDDKDGGGGKRCEKKRASLVGKQRGDVSGRSQGAESRVKKKWEIPSEVVVFRSLEDEEAEKSPLPVAEIGDVLPRIRTFRCVNESPRNSGPAKRVAELVGRRSYFCSNEEVCQALSFGEEEDAVEK
ncbi:hypothetical protein L484_022194 [Morus notabilis]|uniref:Uncharacterized protein n=1 Tax=Morus notabilis TaxID=981085 RepID=W9R0A0_9ROSA|nr:uncharacterized protein LOC21405016 [Morus notabilis]EXB62306.1 hypothetical protein L484_022194 [Morus notabilis]